MVMRSPPDSARARATARAARVTRDSSKGQDTPPSGIRGLAFELPLLALQRSAGNAAVARWLAGEVQTWQPSPVTRLAGRRRAQRQEFEIDQAWDAAERNKLQMAWDLLKVIDQRPFDETELAHVAKVAGRESIHLRIPMLDRIRRLTNTRLEVRGVFGPPGGAGETTLHAKDGQATCKDTGFMAADNMAKFLGARKTKEDRAKVEFTIKVLVKIPKDPSARDRKLGYTVGFFFETLAHELAVHAEKYVDQITRYQADDKPWNPTFEFSEHHELMYAGNPRFMLLYHRLLKSRLAKETLRVPDPAGSGREIEVRAKDLQKLFDKELRLEPMTYHGMTPSSLLDKPVGRTRMLGWIDELANLLVPEEEEEEEEEEGREKSAGSEGPEKSTGSVDATPAVASPTQPAGSSTY